jgi:hypothetical protein
LTPEQADRQYFDAEKRWLESGGRRDGPEYKDYFEATRDLFPANNPNYNPARGSSTGQSPKAFEVPPPTAAGQSPKAFEVPPPAGREPAGPPNINPFGKTIPAADPLANPLGKTQADPLGATQLQNPGPAAPPNINPFGKTMPAADPLANPLGKTQVNPLGATQPQNGGTPCPVPCLVSPAAKTIGGQIGVANVLKGGS